MVLSLGFFVRIRKFPFLKQIDAENNGLLFLCLCASLVALIFSEKGRKFFLLRQEIWRRNLLKINTNDGGKYERRIQNRPGKTLF